MILKNITFGEFLQLDADTAHPYIFAFNHGRELVKPINHFNLLPVDDYRFGQVKDAIFALEKGVTMGDLPEFISIFWRVKPDYFLQFGVVEILQQFAYLKKGLEKIIAVEQKKLVRPLTAKEKAAGIDEFNQYGLYPQFEILAIRFGQTVEWVKNQPYKSMFVSMCYNKTLQDYELRYSKLK